MSDSKLWICKEQKSKPFGPKRRKPKAPKLQMSEPQSRELQKIETLASKRPTNKLRDKIFSISRTRVSEEFFQSEGQKFSSSFEYKVSSEYKLCKGYASESWYQEETKSKYNKYNCKFNLCKKDLSESFSSNKDESRIRFPNTKLKENRHNTGLVNSLSPAKIIEENSIKDKDLEPVEYQRNRFPNTQRNKKPNPNKGSKQDISRSLNPQKDRKTKPKRDGDPKLSKDRQPNLSNGRLLKPPKEFQTIMGPNITRITDPETLYREGRLPRPRRRNRNEPSSSFWPTVAVAAGAASLAIGYIVGRVVAEMDKDDPPRRRDHYDLGFDRKSF